MRQAVSFVLCVSALVLRGAERPRVDFIENILEQSDMAYTTGMKNLVGEVVKAAGADAAQEAALAKAADAAVKEKMERSQNDLWSTWDSMQIDGQVNQAAYWQAYQKLPAAQMTPERFPVWEEAVKQTLNKEQFTKWEVVAKAKRDRIDKAVQTCLDKGREMWVTKRTELRTAFVESLADQLGLSADQSKALLSGSVEAVKTAATKWGGEVEARLRNYVKTAFIGQADAQLQNLENGTMAMGGEDDEVALQAEVDAWEDLVKKVLTPDQHAKLVAQEERKRERRLLSVSQVIVAEIDRKVLLSDQQREKLEELVRRSVRSSEARVEMLLSLPYVNSEMLLALASGVKEEEIKSILEPGQWTGWKEASTRVSLYLDR